MAIRTSEMSARRVVACGSSRHVRCFTICTCVPSSSPTASPAAGADARGDIPGDASVGMTLLPLPRCCCSSPLVGCLARWSRARSESAWSTERPTLCETIAAFTLVRHDACAALWLAYFATVRGESSELRRRCIGAVSLPTASRRDALRLSVHDDRRLPAADDVDDRRLPASTFCDAATASARWFSSAILNEALRCMFAIVR